MAHTGGPDTGERWLPAGLIDAACAALSLGAPGAEDLKGRWSLAVGVFFFSTKDSIRSNAGLVIGPTGDDGIPFTADTNEDLDCSHASTYCDPRPDDQLARPIRIDDAARYDLNLSYGVSSRLSLRLDAGYSKSSIGPIDFFLSDHFPRPSVPGDLRTLTAFKDRDYTRSIRAGELTEIPVTLSAGFRLRVKNDINPCFILGAGKIFTDVGRSDDLRAMNQRLHEQRIRGVTNEIQRNVVPVSIIDFAFDARIPFIWDLKPRVSSALEWHLGAGIEYFFTPRVSLAFEGRYSISRENLELGLGEEDQINIVTWSEEIYRPDGTVAFYSWEPEAPNPLCLENGFRGLGCDPTGPLTQRVDPEGTDRAGRKHFVCPAIGDFDMDGQFDACWGKNVSPSFRGYAEPRGDIIVQGGRINLPAFTAGIGLRFHL